MPIDSVSTDYRNPDGWIGIYSGRRFYFAEPRLEDIDIKDIARALSNLCRFGGHVQEFYSVAQHCVLASQQAPAEYKLEALLHDAGEAYLVDMPRPIKKALSDYRAIETNLDRACATRFGYPYPMSDRVREIDNRLLVTEASQLLGPHMEKWWAEPHPHWEMMGKPQPYTLIIDPWPARKAYLNFLATYDMLTGTPR